MQTIELGVRDFLNLALKTGGLTAEFAPRNRAAEGIATHVSAAGKRPAGYQREVFVRHFFTWQDFTLVISGRIDGILVEDGEVMVEEIKSTYLPLESLNAEGNAFHVAQLKLYHYFESQRRPGVRLTPVLTYVNPLTLDERSFRMKWDVTESRAFFEELAIGFLQRELERRHWRTVRNASLKGLRFPFPSLRPGQVELVETVDQAITGQQDVLVEAATGIGKTMGVLYPALRRLHGQGYSRVFYLTAKSAGVDIVRKTVATLREQGMRMRVLYLQAKERCCPLSGPARPECSEEDCPYALDFYTKAEGILSDLLAHEELTPELIAQAARQETLCPFELSLELSLYSDLIVCDYNYVFDPAVYLRRFFAQGLPNDNLFLIDEAHNLVPRSREMYSATLTEETLNDLHKMVGRGRKGLDVCLDRLRELFAKWREDAEWEGARALRLPELPDEVAPLVDGVLDYTGDILARMAKGEERSALLELYFDLIGFNRIAAEVTSEYAVYVHLARNHGRLRLLCLHPGPKLRTRLERSVSTVLFSATLSPEHYFAELLGARDGYRYLTLDSPFPRENRLYLHVPDVSTRFVAREETKPSVAQVILDVARARVGNYLAFFPSYNYLGTIAAEITLARADDLTVHVQRQGLSMAQQAEFLREVCTPGGERSKLGLAVMGGLFGEAIDLPGEQLVGTIIVGPGLPGVNIEQSLIQEYFEENHAEEGFFYAYIVPGLIRVIQAAGRVFRTPEDRGVVVLMDDRFLEEPYRDLLPEDWDAQDADFSTQEYRGVLEEFWNHPPA
ncbi:MAG TPA: ATP-dependent DNA helicase [Armatimonadota bacterium]